jgi:hypothetical protein
VAPMAAMALRLPQIARIDLSEVSPCETGVWL